MGGGVGDGYLAYRKRCVQFFVSQAYPDDDLIDRRMITMLTCYCAPFSVAIGIYGLIVMLDPAVKQAYSLREQGVPAEEIRARFARARYGF